MQEFDKLKKIVADLRDPQAGCPWDLKQTPKSMIPNFIEELYECIEAIEKESSEDLEEELGDLMLHIVMQVQIAEEQRQFTMQGVLDKISAKLIRRHPHIFGEGAATDAEGVKMNWEKIKMQEKSHRKSVLEGVPKNMPALIVAQRMQEKAAAVGFDWKSVEPAIQKLEEETLEFDEAFQANDRKEMENELGDMLFSIVNISRKLGFDTETALRRTIDKFERRFGYVESKFKAQNRDMKKSSLAELDEVWDEAKAKE
ncbi:MAG: nucleoside triphosphate pyrophosphohydrolase [Candidatus Cloacimonadales bacterium]